MTRCAHCNGRIVSVHGRWVHLSTTPRHGGGARPAFVSCHDGENVATPRGET